MCIELLSNWCYSATKAICENGKKKLLSRRGYSATTAIYVNLLRTMVSEILFQSDLIFFLCFAMFVRWSKVLSITETTEEFKRLWNNVKGVKVREFFAQPIYNRNLSGTCICQLVHSSNSNYRNSFILCVEIFFQLCLYMSM